MFVLQTVDAGTLRVGEGKLSLDVHNNVVDGRLVPTARINTVKCNLALAPLKPERRVVAEATHAIAA